MATFTSILTPAGAALALAAAALVPRAAAAAPAAGLRGSPTSMARQHGVAVGEDFSFLATDAQVRDFVAEGRLEPLQGNADYVLSDVAHPYARPEIRLFVERLAAQYRAATGKRLVVTSLVRPTTEQPGNASPLSVHPAGMAVDLRVPAAAADRAWLERTLLALEGAGVLDVTRERRPPHYHVAVFPAAYREHVAARREAGTPVVVTAAAFVPRRTPAAVALPAVVVEARAVGGEPAGGAAVLLAMTLALTTMAAARWKGETGTGGRGG